MEIAKLLLNVLEPFKSVTLMSSQNCSLSPIYVNVLIFIRGSLINASRKLKELGDHKTDLSPAIDLVNKYLKKTELKCNLLYTSAFLQPSFPDIDCFYKEQSGKTFDSLKKIAQIAIKAGRLDVVDLKLAKPNDNHGMEGSDTTSNHIVTKDLKERNMLEEVQRCIKREFYEYSHFFQKEFEKILKREMDKDGVIAEEKQDGIEYFVLIGGRKLKLTASDIFILNTKVSLKVQHAYRVATNRKTGPVWSHISLPVVIDYLLVLSVTTVNAERIFSAVKNSNEEDGAKLSDNTIYSIQNIRTTDNCKFEFDILKDFGSVKLREVLGHK